MSNDTAPFPFCMQELKEFYTIFGSLHFKLSIVVCLFGTITNILNFIVLTRKDLRTHINMILASLAVSDFLTMVIYIPYSIFGFATTSKYERLTYGYACYIFAHAALSQTSHTISIFLTLMLALWRYVAVCFPNKKMMFMKQTIPVIVASFILSSIVSIPIYISLSIKEFIVTLDLNDTNAMESGELNRTIYKLRPSSIATNHPQALWIYSLLIKLLPCIILTFLSLQLIRALFEAKRRKAKLTGNVSIKLLTKKKQADRTTKMLIAVLVLFLITEFPQGLLGLFSAILHDDFYNYCYQNLGDLMDFLALLNSSINFILYCTMSRQFRETFANIFLPKCLKSRTRLPLDGLMEIDSRGQIETIQDTQMTQL